MSVISSKDAGRGVIDRLALWYDTAHGQLLLSGSWGEEEVIFGSCRQGNGTFGNARHILLTNKKHSKRGKRRKGRRSGEEEEWGGGGGKRGGGRGKRERRRIKREKKTFKTFGSFTTTPHAIASQVGPRVQLSTDPTLQASLCTGQLQIATDISRTRFLSLATEQVLPRGPKLELNKQTIRVQMEATVTFSLYCNLEQVEHLSL